VESVGGNARDVVAWPSSAQQPRRLPDAGLRLAESNGRTDPAGNDPNAAAIPDLSECAQAQRL